MTAIAGLCDRGKVWIGGDSAGVAGLDLEVRADQKVFRNGDFLFGFTTSFRMGQLLRYSFHPPKPSVDQDLYEFMVNAFVDAVRNCLKIGGFASKLNETESGGTFLLGYGGRLFTVQSDYQVSETADGYSAAGCGDQIIRGALFATKGMEAEERIRLALAAAERYNAGVRGPFRVESI